MGGSRKGQWDWVKHLCVTARPGMGGSLESLSSFEATKSIHCLSSPVRGCCVGAKSLCEGALGAGLGNVQAEGSSGIFDLVTSKGTTHVD